MNTDTVISQRKKKEPVLESVNTALLCPLNPEEVTVEIERTGEAKMDEIWSFVDRTTDPRWLWHTIDHPTGKVLAYVFGRCQDEIFLKLEAFAGAFRSDARLPR
jgi:insertion element IS1 protein InsB